MSGNWRREHDGPSRHLTAHAEARREGIDEVARRRADDLPVWATSMLDLALAAGLVRDADLPSASKDVADLVRHYGWALGELHRLVGAGLIEARDVALMSWEGRAFVARLAIDAGPDLTQRIDDLRGVAA